MDDLAISTRLDAIAAGGEIDLDELTGLAQQLLRVDANLPAVLAIAVAVARQHFGTDMTAWVIWCRDELALDDISYRSHLNRVGSLLLWLRDHARPGYTTVFALDHSKQYALTALPVEQVPAFLSDLGRGIADMTRHELRRQIARWLNIPEPETPHQLTLPGFDDVLATVDHLTADELKNHISTPERALRSFGVGGAYLEAAIAYEVSSPTPNAELLATAKLELTNMMHTIDEALDHVTPAGQN